MRRLLEKRAWSASALVVAVLGVTQPLVASARAQEPDLSKAPRITMAEFRKLHAGDKVLVIDVRDDLSFAAGHIPGSRNIPVSQLLDPRTLAALETAGKPIVLYCA